MNELLELEKLIATALMDCGFSFIQASRYNNHGQPVVQIMIERMDEKQLTFKDCTQATNKILEKLDQQDPIGGDYTVEVSSPGLERPLLKIEDFQRFQGSLAKIVLKEKIDGVRHFNGRIKEVSEKISIEIVPSGKIISFQYDNIKNANLAIEEDIKEIIEQTVKK